MHSVLLELALSLAINTTEFTKETAFQLVNWKMSKINSIAWRVQRQLHTEVHVDPFRQNRRTQSINFRMTSNQITLSTVS